MSILGLIILGVLVDLTFYKPTKINKYVATRLYKTLANSSFDDQNFYNCVVDAYNSKNTTKLPYTTNLTTDQLKTINSVSCSNKYVSNINGISLLINLKYLYVSYNQLTSIDVSNNTSLTSLRASSN